MVGSYEQAKVWCLVDERVSDGAWGRFFDLVEVVEVEGESLGQRSQVKLGLTLMLMAMPIAKILA